MLCKHIPDRYEHLVRYVGWYSNRARGERAKALKTLKAQDPATKPGTSVETMGAFATRAKATWARLIRKVYEADPLVCPKCKGLPPHPRHRVAQRDLASTGIAIGRAQVQHALGALLGSAKSAENHRDSRAREKSLEVREMHIDIFGEEPLSGTCGTDRISRRKFLHAGLMIFAALAAYVPQVAKAQGTYPERPVRLVVPFAPGGSTDVLGRKLAAKLGPLLGQSVVVENKAGAAGVIGCTEVAHSRPDGYTLIIGTTGTHAINPSTMVNPTYDAVRDFTPIAVLGTQPFSIAIHPSLPAKTLLDLVSLVRSNPGKYAYASAGAGGIAHLTAELFKQLAGGLDITHVPYRGGGPALQDVLAGQVSIFSDSFSTTYPHHRSGRLRVLAMTGAKRSPAAPDIPTAIEAGMPALVSSTAGILLAPARTPQPIIEILQRVVMKVMADEAFLKDLEALSIEPIPDSDPNKAAQFIKSEIAKWAPIIKATGTRME